MKILITGGAGFIGTHLTRYLLTQGQQVTILDNFLAQVHANAELAPDIRAHVRMVEGDVANTEDLRTALQGVECVIHLAAETGTGQSMYEVSRYGRTNLGGTAALYELLAKDPKHEVQRIIAASSRAVYGEGAYLCQRDGFVYPISRSGKDKQAGHFDPECPVCAGECEPAPTPEAAPFQPSSFYGLTKQVQEQAAMMFGKALQIPTCALRYQNVYGPGQSLRNPYTGILAIFSNLARAGHRLQVFEDGRESRDFVYIDDVVRATAACVSIDLRGCHVVNVGSNSRTSVLEVAQQVSAFYGGRSAVEVTGAFREGDIRHGIGDLTLAGLLLGYAPQWEFREGLRQFLEWASENELESTLSGYEKSLVEMAEKGIFHGQR